MYVPRSYMENRNFLTQTWSLWVYLDICESCIFYYRNYRLFDSGRSPWKSLGLVLRWWRHSVAKTIIFSKAGWRRQILKILFAEREIQRRSWAGCTGWHWWSAKKKRSTRRVFKRQDFLDKPSGVITWHSVIKAEIPKHTPPGLGSIRDLQHSTVSWVSSDSRTNATPMTVPRSLKEILQKLQKL